MRRSKSSPKVQDVQHDPDVIHPVLRSYLGYALIKLTTRLRGTFCKSLEPIGLIPPHLGILSLLDKETDGLSQIALSELTGVDKASMVKLLDALEGQGFVKRSSHPTDRRVKLVSLTAAGTKAFRQAKLLTEKTEAEFLGKLNAKEQKTLRELLQKLL